MERWFEPGREIVVLSDSDDASEVYQDLLTDESLLGKMGEAARKRVQKDHTYSRRAAELVRMISNSKREDT
jgi:spore maturation protein CgeB